MVNFGKNSINLENMKTEKWLKIGQIANYLQISTEKVYKLAQQGKIPASKVGGQWRFKRRRIDDWLERQENNHN